MPSRIVASGWASALLSALFAGEAVSLVASCPDGSVILAKKWEDVHCPGAVEVPPGAPSPLGDVRSHFSAAGQARLRGAETAREDDLDAQLDGALTRPPVAIAADVRTGLAALIAASQPYAGIDREAEGLAPLEMRLAYSPAFERMLAAALGPLKGPVLVFALTPSSKPFADSAPSFAQGGARYRPEGGEPRQLGWIASLDPERTHDVPSLGYVVLPPGFELDRPILLFWGDAVAAAWLEGAGS